MPELNQTTVLREVLLARVSTDGSLTSSQEGVALRNDSDSPGANKVYGTDEDGTKGWVNPSSIPLVDFATELTFDRDKELSTVTGEARVFTLSATSNENGVGIIVRINTPVSVSFPDSFEAINGSDDISTTHMNILIFRYYENYDGAGNDKVLYINKNQTAI